LLLATGSSHSEELRFIVHTTKGAFQPAPLEEIKEDWSISVGGMGSQHVPAGDALSLHQVGIRVPGSPATEHVVSPFGDQLVGNITQLQHDRLKLAAEFDHRNRTSQEINVPLSLLSLLWLVAPSEAAPAGEAVRRVVSGRRRHDTAVLRNGDLFEGTLAAIDDKSVDMSVGRNKSTRLERGSVACIALSTELARRPRLKHPFGRLILTNGSRLTLTSARSDGQVLNGKTLFGETVQVSVEQIAALYVYGDRTTYLSELKPVKYEQTPYLDISWPYRIDANVVDEPIRVGGSTYEKGIGMHSESRLTYTLPADYQWFEAWVGLDDHTGKDGSVAIAVLLDSKPQRLGLEEELTASNSPCAIRIKVVGARELTLVVKFGRHGDVQDHVDWADARLVK
jgi:hypothetical protein